jgi:hypothetical protein
LFNGSGQPLKDLIWGSHPIDGHQAASRAIELNKRLSLGFVEVKTAIDGIWGVVVTLDHVPTTVLTGPWLRFIAHGLIVGGAISAHSSG